MNRRVVAIGVAIAVIGAAVWYVPLEPGSTGAETVASFDRSIQLYAPFDVLGYPISFSLAWSTSYPVSAIVQLFACGDRASCTNARSIGSETGDHGSFSWKGAAGEYFLFESSVKPMTIDLRYAEPLLGGALGAAAVTFGGFLIAIGYLFVPARGAPRPVAEYTGPADAAPSSGGASPTDDEGSPSR